MDQDKEDYEGESSSFRRILIPFSTRRVKIVGLLVRPSTTLQFGQASGKRSAKEPAYYCSLSVWSSSTRCASPAVYSALCNSTLTENDRRD